MTDNMHGRWSVIGLPYHGLTRNKVLTLPDGSTKSTATIDGPSHVVRHPSAPGDTRSSAEKAADLANGLEYRNYLLISGSSKRYIGGFGYLTMTFPSGGKGFIYVDPAGTPWWLQFVYFSSGSHQIRLYKRFGDLTNTSGAIINSILATQTITPESHTISTTHTMTQKEDGSAVKINVYEKFDVYTGYNSAMEGNQSRLTHIITVDITGTGDTNPGTLGDGITATATIEDITKPADVGNSYSTTGSITGMYDSSYVVGGQHRAHGNDISDPQYICFVPESGDNGLYTEIITDEVLGEWYEGNTVVRVTSHTENISEGKSDFYASGCVDCFTVGEPDTFSGGSVISYALARITRTITAGSSSWVTVWQKEHTGETWDGNYYHDCRYVSVHGAWLGQDTAAFDAAYDASETGFNTSTVFMTQDGTIQVNLESSIGIRSMGLETSAPKPATLAPLHVAVNPEEGLIQTHESDSIAYL